jgi:hypothetical protein
MASNTIRRLAGPVTLSTTLTTNIYNPPTFSAGVGTQNAQYGILRHLHIANRTGSAATFTLYIGATGANAAGTEFFVAKSVAANDVYDWYGALRFDIADFLVGGAGTATALTLILEGEVGVI